jgi:hypothetical protein
VLRVRMADSPAVLEQQVDDVAQRAHLDPPHLGHEPPLGTRLGKLTQRAQQACIGAPVSLAIAGLLVAWSLRGMYLIAGGAMIVTAACAALPKQVRQIGALANADGWDSARKAGNWSGR